MGKKKSKTTSILGVKIKKTSAMLGIFFVILIAMFGGMYAVMGSPVYNAESIDTTNFVAYTAAGLNANCTGVSTSGNTLSFTPAAAAAKLVIPLKDEWKDAKGSFNMLHIDLSNIQEAAVWDLAKVYLSDGTTDAYIGSIKKDVKSATLSVSSDDTKNLDDFQKAEIIIKFYDSNGTLTDVLASGVEQDIDIWTTVSIDTSTVAGFFTSIALAVIVAIRKAASAVTGSLTSFFLAITTNSALLTVMGGLVVIFGLYMITEHKIKM